MCREFFCGSISKGHLIGHRRDHTVREAGVAVLQIRGMDGEWWTQCIEHRKQNAESL